MKANKDIARHTKTEGSRQQEVTATSNIFFIKRPSGQKKNDTRKKYGFT